MIKNLSKTRLGIVAALLVSSGLTADAQRGANRSSDQQVGPILQRIETSTQAFRTSLGAMAGQGRPQGTGRGEDISRFVGDLEGATLWLRGRYDQQLAIAADAQDVMNCASIIDSFMSRRQLDARTERDWGSLRVNLEQLARNYQVSWRPEAWVNARQAGQGEYMTDRLTGTYRLDPSRSDNPEDVVARIARGLGDGEQQRLRAGITRRLESPTSLAIERRGRTIMMASSLAPQVTFEADGRDQVEQAGNGRSMHTTVTLSGDQLTIDSTGDRTSDYRISFLPTDTGRGLRVTRRISDDRLAQPVVVNSVYTRTSDTAQRDLYTGTRDYTGRANPPSGAFYVPDGTQLTAVLNDPLSTKQARPEDRFALTVRSPAQYEGAVIDGHLASVNRSGQVSGRAEMSFEFDRIRLRDGRTAPFTGDIDSVRTPAGETIRVDNESRAQGDSQTNSTVTRTGVGAAIGAVIGAIVGGGQGAAIGGAVGAGAGAGSVYVQGRDDLELARGAEFLVRASVPR